METCDFERKCYENFERENREADVLTPVTGLGYIFAAYLHRKQRIELEKRREIFWITINPKPDVTFEQLRSTIRGRLMPRIIMKGALYVFEQRSEDPENPHGFHCHILVDKKMSPKQMYDRVRSTVASIIGTSKALDVRAYPYTYRTEKLEYLKGSKWDDEKSAAVNATRTWRQNNGIPDMYEA